ncbi:MAG: hypothetical protein R3F62_13590 [Planctomycetota bacterium]
MRALWIPAGAALLLCGLTVHGCSGGSSRGSASAAAPVTSSASATPSSGASGGLPQTPASQGTPLGVFNAELQGVWDRLRPQILGQLDALVAQQLNRQLYQSGSLAVEVVNANLSQRSDLRAAPGVLQLDPQTILVRAPEQGTWSVVLALDLRVTLSVGSLSPAIDVPVEVVLDALSLELSAGLDDSDPTRPRFRRVDAPRVDFSLRVDSQNALAQRLTGVLTGPANWVAQQALALVLRSLAPNLAALVGVPGAIPGEGAPPLVDSGTQVPFAEVVDRVELKLRQVNQPHGPVLTAYVDQPATTTWLDAYRAGGPGVQGSVVGYEGGGDAAIWTGHYLAAEAFRYAADGGSSLALDSVGHTLKGVGALLDVNGGSGLLARNAAPEASLAGQAIRRTQVFRQATLFGETWIGRQGSHGISRDQYSGVFLGLSLAYEHVPPARAECQRRVEQMLDYLIGRGWIVDEDRPAWNGQAGSSRGPTFWAGVGYQKLAFLLIGHRMNPARYAAELAQAGPLSKLVWFGLWTGTWGVDHYYKFNLAHAGLYNLLRLETDAGRWQDVRRGYALLERYVGHHRNAHFDLIRTTIDPSTQPALYGSTREALRQFAGTPHRELAPAVIDLSGVTWVNLQVFGYQNTGSGGVTLQGSTAAFPSEPLPMHLRRPTGHFIWQRDPFTPATPSEGNPRAETCGLDLVLPYWMGRHLGAF